MKRVFIFSIKKGWYKESGKQKKGEYVHRISSFLDALTVEKVSDCTGAEAKGAHADGADGSRQASGTNAR